MHEWSAHTPYSNPGKHRALVEQLPDDVDQVCAAARNVIGHYRAELPDLPEERRDEINSRWLEAILDLDQARHPSPLRDPREPAHRVAGCCRDHALFVVGALRQRGIPARSRVGFAGYFAPDYHVDHVVAEYRDGGRWRRVDPELAPGSRPFDAGDLRAGPSAPFVTAAEVWRGYRRKDLDPARYGVFPGSELAGPAFIRGYVIFEVAHRFGDELLLWDEWGATGGAGAGAGAEGQDAAFIDALAAGLIDADAGDAAAEQDLAEQYAKDPRLRPSDVVTQHSPFGEPPQRVSLRRPRSTGGASRAG